MSTASTPPRGDYQKAEAYLNKLIPLLESNKLEVIHTDLQKFDPGTIQDHYRLDLEDYQIELSHSKLPNSGTDSYVMLFTNLKKVEAGTAEKTILAYTQLSDTQFQRFKTAAEAQIEERRRKEEEKRFNEALSPIDSILSNITSQTTSTHAPFQSSHNEHSHSSSEEPKSNLFTPPATSDLSSNEFSFYKSKGISPHEEKTESKPDSNPYF